MRFPELGTAIRFKQKRQGEHKVALPLNVA